ncbi:hypothetical protein D3C85_1808900 [compost metagenome]
MKLLLGEVQHLGGKDEVQMVESLLQMGFRSGVQLLAASRAFQEVKRVHQFG